MQWDDDDGSGCDAHRRHMAPFRSFDAQQRVISYGWRPRSTARQAPSAPRQSTVPGLPSTMRGSKMPLALSNSPCAALRAALANDKSLSDRPFVIGTASSAPRRLQTPNKLVWTVVPNEAQLRVLSRAAVPRPQSVRGVRLPRLAAHVGLADTIGHRPSMEDHFVLAEQTIGRKHLTLLGVCDGHGGDRVAQLVARDWPALLFDFCSAIAQAPTLDAEHAMIGRAAEASLQAMDDRVHGELLRGPQSRVDIGSTLCALLFVNQTHFYVINVGDSRALAVKSDGSLWSGASLSVDDKPERDDERRRIEALGGHVSVHDGVARVMGNLSVSRSLGDFHLKPYVSAEPTISKPISCTDIAACVVCCDGVTDVLCNEDIAQTVGESCAHEQQRQRAAQRANAAAQSAAVCLRNRAFLSGSGDNISALVVLLNVADD